MCRSDGGIRFRLVSPKDLWIMCGQNFNYTNACLSDWNTCSIPSTNEQSKEGFFWLFLQTVRSLFLKQNLASRSYLQFIKLLNKICMEIFIAKNYEKLCACSANTGLLYLRNQMWGPKLLFSFDPFHHILSVCLLSLNSLSVIESHSDIPIRPPLTRLIFRTFYWKLKAKN